MSDVLPAEAPRATRPRPRPRPLYPKLQPRWCGLDRDGVASNQRERIRGAMIEAVAEHGYAGASIKRVSALAGVSRQTFYDLFGSREACLLATYDEILASTIERIGGAYHSEGDWRAGLRAAFEAYAAEVVARPKEARLALVEVLGAGPAALARMRATRLLVERILSANFDEAPDGITLPPLVVKGIVCGMERITRRRLLAGDVRELPELVDELLAWALSYRSPAAAALIATATAREQWRAPDRPPAQPENDWARILRCTAQIAATKGYDRLTPTAIMRAAGVSEATFDELFESTEQCFLDALDRLGLEALVCAAKAAQTSEDRLAGAHRGMVALMEHVASNPVLLRLAFVEIFALGPPGIERRERLLKQFIVLLSKSVPRPQRSSQVVAEASAGAIWGIVHHHVTKGATRQLPGLASYATYLALTPAIGGERALAAILAGERGGPEAGDLDPPGRSRAVRAV